MESPGVDSAPSVGTGRFGQLLRPGLLIRAGAGALVVAVGVAAAFYFTIGNGDEDETGELLEAPVSLGTLVDSVSSDGTIVFPGRSELGFGSAGTVGEILVGVGESVAEGQVLARLDPLTASNLAAAVEEARSALEIAIERLDEATIGATALEIARARQEVNKAQSALDKLLANPDADRLAALAAVAKAETDLTSAKEALSDMEALLTPNAIADARAELVLATDAYEGAVSELARTESEWVEKIENANTALADATAAYVAEFDGWFGVTLSEDQLELPPSDVLATWGATYESIYVRDVSAPLGTDEDDPDTPWSEFTVSLWTRVFPFGVDATCEPSGPSGDVPCVQKEVEDAWAAINTAEEALEDTTPDRAAALTAANKAVSAAEASMNAAEEAANYATAPSTVTALEAAQNAVSLAEGDLLIANLALDAIDSPAAGDLSPYENSLQIARAELSDAQAHLAEISNPDDSLVALRASEVDVAEAELDRAEELLAIATIKSPVNGIVDAINFSAGDDVQRTATIIEVIDPSVVTIEMDVAQVDILSVAVGAEAAVALDALPGRILEGEVSDIGSASGGQSGSVTFPVTVSVDIPSDVQLLEGLTANAQMITNTRSNVLLVPSVAVGGTFTQPTLDVVRDGQTETVNVSLDGGNETFAVIGSGVSEGDTVVFRLPGVTEDTNPFSVIRAGVGGFGGGVTGTRGGFIGGAPGGGGRPQP